LLQGLCGQFLVAGMIGADRAVAQDPGPFVFTIGLRDTGGRMVERLFGGGQVLQGLRVVGLVGSS